MPTSETLNIVTEVAAAFGPSFDQVWRQPFHLTLLAFCGLVDKRRLDALERKAERFELTALINAAVVDTKRYTSERRAFLSELRRGRPGVGSDAPTDDELLESLAGWGRVLQHNTAPSVS